MMPGWEVARARLLAKAQLNALALEAAMDYVAVQRDRSGEQPHRVAIAARQWGLRPQEKRVLSHLVQGEGNRAIAAKLGCGERTVELHVTRILQRSGAWSRTELIARFWSGT